MRRIKWLSRNDWALGTSLKRMDEICKSFDETNVYSNVNDIMELYVVSKYMEVSLYPSNWNDMEIEIYTLIHKKMKGVLGKYFSRLNNQNFQDIYLQLNMYYRKLFWEAFSLYKLYKKIDFSNIENIIETKNDISTILLEKAIVDAYGEEIRKELLAFKNSAELLLDEYEVYHEHDKSKLYFPKELSVDDKKQIIDNYVNRNEVNPNYLSIIVNIQDNPDTLIIGDRIRLQARKKYQKYVEKIFSENSGFTTDIAVGFEQLNGDELIMEMNSHRIVCKYDTTWIEENLDEPTLLNNFIFLFGYVDNQWRISFVEKDVHKNIFEKTLFMRSKHAYAPGYSTELLNTLADMQIRAYYQQLQRCGKSLENVLKWFFEEYLVKEFSIKGFRMNVPSVNTNYLEKCRTMLSEMDGILKQYNLYVEDGYVDQELFQISSSHMKFSDCKSVLEDKYVYGTGDEFSIVCHHLFSDQSLISYVERIEESYDSFYELLKNEEIYDTDIADYTKVIFEWLINHEYITIVNNRIVFKNLTRVLLLKELYENNVISFWHLNEKYRNELLKMKDDKLVYFHSSLFAQKEHEYFDYYLNKATFNNGIDLRNMYLHGSQPNKPEDEKIHMKNYWIILKLFVLCVMKINDDVESSSLISDQSN